MAISENRLKDMQERWRIAFAANGHDDAMALINEVWRLRAVLEEIAEGAVDDPQVDTALELMRMAREALEGE